ncbi:MAG TPA: hypothetical protein VJ697_04045 [Nitrososphaeraceae archaeon]|nr:hypothetical protein [Nitrososphaeraceae archaeon]
MWQVANGEDKDLVLPRGNHVSLSNETTLENFTLDRQIIKHSLYALVDELFERIKHNNYQFRTVGIILVRTDFSIETREKSYTNYQYKRNNIESIIEELLNKINLEKNISSESASTTNSKKQNTEKILFVRKVGLKVTNLLLVDNNNNNDNRNNDNKNKQFRQMTLSDYV